MSEAEIQALLRDYEVKLDHQSENETKVLGAGAYGTVINVKVNGAACVAKRLHDILLGIQGYEPVSMDQWLPMLKKFEEECKLLSKMRHPNVVQFIGVCELDPQEPRTLALVMERLHTDLGRYIGNAPGEIPLPVKLNILHDTSNGLLYLHSHNVIHRDLNAGNVLLTENLRAKVADLGVARVMETVSTKRYAANLTQTPGCLDYMPPEALKQNPEYGTKLDCFSFGHLMLYLIIQENPTPYDPMFDSLHPHAPHSVGYQIQKRQTWIDKISYGHCLNNLVIRCLQDKPKNRPEMREINEELESLCKAHPQETGQSQDFDELLEQLTEIKETTGKLMSEPMEMSALHKHVSDLEEQNAQEAEKIQRTKEQVQFSQELLKRKSEQIEALSSQMRVLETQVIQRLAHVGGGNETARCTQLEEQLHRMQEENAVKDSELNGVREELQHVREELQQLSEESRKNVGDLTAALRKAETNYASLQEEKNAELADKVEQIDQLETQLADKVEQIDHLETQVKAETEARLQAGELLRERSAELDNARKENSELQMVIDRLKKEADTRKRSATLDEDQRHNSETNQVQKNPKSATLPPVPLKRSATLQRKKEPVSVPYHHISQGSMEVTNQPVQPPVPLRRTKPTTDQSGPIPTSAQQPAPVRPRPASVIQDAGRMVEINDELMRKLQKRRLRSESINVSKEKDQPDLPQTNEHM